LPIPSSAYLAAQACPPMKVAHHLRTCQRTKVVLCRCLSVCVPFSVCSSRGVCNQKQCESTTSYGKFEANHVHVPNQLHLCHSPLPRNAPDLLVCFLPLAHSQCVSPQPRAPFCFVQVFCESQRKLHIRPFCSFPTCPYPKASSPPFHFVVLSIS